ncbi:MAG: hypothetical protein Q9159_004656 [Coniocarpon cinnabarinum]
MEQQVIYLSGPLRGERNVSWTTSRCNRLLRPLISKTSALARAKAKSITSTTSDCDLESSSCSSQEPGQLPQLSDRDVFRKASRVKRTYAGRCARRALRASGAKEPSPPSSAHDYAGAPDRCSARTGNEVLSWASSVCAYGLASLSQRESRAKGGICEAFSNIIDATKAPPSVPCHDKSLFATCLRKLPEVVEYEQARRLEEDPDDESDVRGEIWGSLEEEFVSASKHGWPHMQLVLRSHGVHVVKRSIEQGVLEPTDVYEIDQVCFFEASRIVSTVTNISDLAVNGLPSIQPSLRVTMAAA